MDRKESAMNMLLAADIGNSTVGLGLFPEPFKSSQLFIKKIPTNLPHPVETYKKIILEFIRDTSMNLISQATDQEKTSPLSPNSELNAPLKIDAIVSSVVSFLDQPIINAIKDTCDKNPLIVDHKIEGSLTLAITRPEEIGADRIANAVAGFYYSKEPVAIVDFGTATTISVVGREQNLVGGAILPGIELMQKALHLGTTKLPLISLKTPEKVIGKNTEASIMSGVIYGTVGAVETLIKGMEKELGLRLKLILTGGNAGFVSPLIKREHILIPALTFEGLRLIYIKNSGFSSNRDEI
ncbi:type III pantothenate kinase [Thermodesulfovibrionales bacterium]|nr:type III pantothenate kinase [Thermodesulfovibrionales bacterium]